MKKMFIRIKELITWFMSKKVLDAINNGATYDEVVQIVHEEVYNVTNR